MNFSREEVQPLLDAYEDLHEQLCGAVCSEHQSGVSVLGLAEDAVPLLNLPSGYVSVRRNRKGGLGDFLLHCSVCGDVGSFPI